MNQILYENRCKCNEEFSITKKCSVKTLSEGRPIIYSGFKEITPGPSSKEIKSKKLYNPNGLTSKTFHMNYQKELSLTATLILNSFQNKYIYYAIDDILDALNSNPVERDNLLAVLYSPILSLQNNFSINFFNIWIGEVYIDEISKPNKFLKHESKTIKQFNSITIKFFYKPSVLPKKRETLW